MRLYLTELFRLTSEVHNYNARGIKFNMQLPKFKKKFSLSFSVFNWLIWRKECGSVLSSGLWGGALLDDTKNGCVADQQR